MTGFTASKSRLFVISAMALYTEVVLIRWMSAEIRMFAYLKNFTLFACFFGFGPGNDEPQAPSGGKALADIDGSDGLGAGFLLRNCISPGFFFPDTRRLPVGRKLAFLRSSLPAARSLPVLGALLRPHAGFLCALDARSIRTRRPAPRYFCLVLAIFLSDRHAGGRMPGRPPGLLCKPTL